MKERMRERQRERERKRKRFTDRVGKSFRERETEKEVYR